jgi:signal transduction histidine kinase/HAMP domain-containing protein
MARFSFSKLRIRLLFLFLVALLPALGLIQYTSSKLRGVMGLDAQQESLHLVRTLAAEHERIIESGHQLLIALANLPEVLRYDTEGCSKVFSDVVRNFKFFTTLTAAKPNGDVFCSTTISPTPVNFSDRPYFKQVLRTRAFTMSDFTIGRFSKKPIVTLSYPSIDDRRELRAVLVIGLDLSWFHEIVAESRLLRGSNVTVIDRNRVILARDPDPEGLTGKITPEASIVETVLNRREGTTEAVGRDGLPRLYAFTALRGLSQAGTVYVWADIPQNVVFAEPDRILAMNIAGLGVVAILTFVLAWAGSNTFVLRPVNALIHATKRISGGELEARAGVTYDKGEFGQLARSFDAMAESLERRYQQTKALHDIDLAIASTLDLLPMLNLLLEKIDVALPNAVTTIRLINKETGELEPVACRNLDEDAWRAESQRDVHGFAKILLENKTAITIANVQTDPRNMNRHFVRRFGLVSYLGIPLIAKAEILGVIAFYTREEHAFSDEEIEFLTTLAGQSAIAIHNVHLYEETKQRAYELSALHALTAAATQSLDLNVVLNEAVKKITEIFHFDATRIFLFNAGMDELEVKAAFEVKPEFWTQVMIFQRGQGLVGTVAETGEALIFEDIRHDPRYRELSQSRSSEKAGAFFLAAFPVRTKAKNWGALVCVGEKPRKLKGNEISLLTSMTNQIGIAVENASLYQQTAMKAKELSALYSVAGIASESLDIIIVLRKTMDKLLEIFGFDAARIYLCEGDGRELRLVAYEGFPKDSPPLEFYRLGEGLLGRAVEKGEPLIFDDMQNSITFAKIANRRLMLKAGFRGSFFIPIRVRSESLGVMNLLSKEPHHFSESEVHLINAIAYHLGIAVGNANLFFATKQKTVELEKANKAKDEFLGVVSHELRTPLNVIKGYTELIKERALGEINGEQEKALVKIMTQSMNLWSMINSVLQVTKIQAEAVTVQSRDFNLYEFLSSLRSDYEGFVGKEQMIRWDYSPELSVVRTDDEKLKAILQNLINNAIKFTEKGDVVVSVRHVPDAKRIEFKVTDTGIGIPKERIPFIFDMFEQVDSSTTRRHGGVGLGLYITKKFTELLGASIEVKSRIKEGSTFIVSLPIVPAAELPDSKDLPPSL